MGVTKKLIVQGFIQYVKMAFKELVHKYKVLGIVLTIIGIIFGATFFVQILNVQSYPTVGSPWVTNFSAIGRGDLTITPFNGTRFGDDLEFISLKCGDNIVTPTEITDLYIKFDNYYCFSESHFEVKVLSSGVHNIKFEFGSEVGYSHNNASMPSRLIGYEFLDNNTVVHIWNNATISDYYFEKDSGIQLTNHYDDYWTKNIFCVGYYNNNVWNKIACVDDLSSFQRNIETDNFTYVQATLWKDIEYGVYDLRIGVGYDLGLNDDSLSITVYGKNIGQNIPFNIGFAWKITDWEIPSSKISNDSIKINNTRYALNGTYNLVFKNMTKSYTNLTFNEENGELIDNGLIIEPISKLKGYDYTNFLQIDWNENLNYAVKMFGNGNKEDFYVTLLINAGHFNPQQEKSTTFQWIDASTEITTWTELAGISSTLDGDYVLMNDLGSGDNGYDTYASSSANSGAGWLPLGDSSSKFTGTFDGNEFVISDLYINRTTNYNGLFGYIGGATINDLGLEDVNITQTGGGWTAGLVGGGTLIILSNTIYNCFVTGTIVGGYYSGGFIGDGSYSTIYDSYTNVNINGQNIVGGFIGRLINSANVQRCYASGTLIGSGTKGGFAGQDFSTDANNFYDNETSGQTDTIGALPKSTSEMKTLTTFNSTWDIVLSDDYINEDWYIDDGNDYPKLGWEYVKPSDITLPIYSDNSTNSTLAGTNIEHRLKWGDDTALSGYIFSFDNGTGTLVNDSWTAFSSNPDWSNVTKTITSGGGATIRWCVYANDTSDNWNSTSCDNPFSYITTINITITNVSITPDPAIYTDNLTGFCNATHSTSETLAYTYDWLINGTTQNMFDNNSWNSNTTTVAGIAAVNGYSNGCVFQDGNTLKFIAGQGEPGGFFGYHWNGTSWVSNSTIIAGLVVNNVYTAPTVFDDSGTWKLISGRHDGTFDGYHWNGTSWVTNSTIIAGLADTNYYSKPTVFIDGETVKLITGKHGGDYDGYHWGGSSWTSNSSVINGLSDIGDYTSVEVFDDNSVFKLITSEVDGVFFGFSWNGNSWVSDPSIISGLVSPGAISTAAVYKDSYNWKVIVGVNSGGGWTGYNLGTKNLSNDYFSATDEVILECTASDGTYFDILNSSTLIIGSGNSCACPGLNEDWNIIMSDNCEINTNCDIGTGTLSVTGDDGILTITALITAKKISREPDNFDGGYMILIGSGGQLISS